MKYISFTFDDGRRDNYTYAYPVMKMNNLVGTLFCTTGYIDGSWQKDKSWHSAEKAIRICELKELQKNGWELALHGDRHTTDVNDLQCALEKMRTWGIAKGPLGFSVPNSNVENKKLKEVIDKYFESELLYIRVGRRIKIQKVLTKVLFALYTVGRMQWAYNCFNNKNLTDMKHINRECICSIVIRYGDSSDMIMKFIEQIPDDTCAVFMFHSILPEESKYYGSDPWNWSLSQFEKLCSGIKRLESIGKVKAITLGQIAARIQERKGE